MGNRRWQTHPPWPRSPPRSNRLLQKRRDLFAGDDLFKCLARVDLLEGAAFHEHLGGHAAGVVATGHRVAIGPTAHERDELALADFLELAVLGEAITAF